MEARTPSSAPCSSQKALRCRAAAFATFHTSVGNRAEIARFQYAARPRLVIRPVSPGQIGLPRLISAVAPPLLRSFLYNRKSLSSAVCGGTNAMMKHLVLIGAIVAIVGAGAV